MRNFILFVVVALVLGFAGYILYRVYIVGDSPDVVFQELRVSEERPDYLVEGKQAYRERDYPQAAPTLDRALEAHDSGEPGATLEEEEYKELLVMIGSSYYQLWKAGDFTDDSLRRRAEEIYLRYLEEFPDRNDKRRVGRSLAKVRKQPPTTRPVTDESPP